MSLYELNNKKPQIHPGVACISPNAVIIGEGALIPQKVQTPALVLAVGIRAKMVKTLGGEAEQQAIDVAGHYEEYRGTVMMRKPMMM